MKPVQAKVKMVEMEARKVAVMLEGWKMMERPSSEAVDPGGGVLLWSDVGITNL